MLSRQVLSFEIIWRRGPNFIGFSDDCFSRLFSAGFVDILLPVVHRLGDFRKSARGLGAPRLFCSNAGFSGSPNGVAHAVGRRGSAACISAMKLVPGLSEDFFKLGYSDLAYYCWFLRK